MDPFELAFAVGALVALLIAVVAVIVWPIEDRRIRIDVIDQVHGDQPQLPS